MPGAGSSPGGECCILIREAERMPMYEYRCQECGKQFEMLRRMQDADEELECPECQSEDVQRLLSTFAAGGCSTSGSGGFS